LLSAIGALLFFPTAFWLLLAWAFKDGIAPDAGYSEGWHAWSLFFQDTWPFLLVVIAFVIAGYFANRRARRRIEASREPQGSLLNL
jgi:hypothetical protein